MTQLYVESVEHWPAGPWGPWTHDPIIVVSESHPGVLMAVFTKADYGDHGISVVTKPGCLEADIMTAARPRSPTAQPATLPYQVVDIPGKGKGAVATRRILKEEIIVAEDPVLILHDGMENFFDDADITEALNHAVRQLPHPEVFLDLARCNRHTNAARDVFNTNSFHSMLGRTSHTMVFPKISRLNHACDAEATMVYAACEGAGKVRAARDIQEGQEIHLNYMHTVPSFNQRKRELCKWGIVCECALCTTERACNGRHT